MSGAVIAALAIEPGQTLVIGGSGLATSDYLRLFLVLGSVVGARADVAGLASGTRRDAPAVTLMILGSAALTMALVDPRLAVLAATTGGLFGVLITLTPRDGRVGATVGILETRAVVVAGALAIAATAWLGRDLSQLDAQPVVFGLAYLAFAVAVAMRFGAIPFHLWAARLTDVVPETALPGPDGVRAGIAGGRRPGLGRVDGRAAGSADLTLERYVVLAIAVATIVLAAVAAFVQDDLEHVLGYSIVGDAGVIVLALAVVGPDALEPGRMWILAFIVARGAFAVWAAGIRAGFFTGRVGDLRGWARRSPILAIAFILVAVASVGFPGLAAFEARASLVGLAVVPPLDVLLGIVVLVPVIYYGRLLVIGLSPPDRVGEPLVSWRPHAVRPDLTSLRHWSRKTWDGEPGIHDGVGGGVAGSAGAGDRGRRVRWVGGRRRTDPDGHDPGRIRRAGPSLGCRRHGCRLRRHRRPPTGVESQPVCRAGAWVRRTLCVGDALSGRPAAPLVVRGEHPQVGVALVVEQLGRVEPQRELGGGGLGAVRRMDDVLRGLEREVAADRARRSLVRSRRAVDRADDRDGVRPVEGERDERRRDDEVDQPGEERLLAMCRVVPLGEVAIDPNELEPDDLEAACFVAREDAADQLALDAVGLDEDEGSFGAWHVFLGYGRGGRRGIVSDGRRGSGRRVARGPG